MVFLKRILALLSAVLMLAIICGCNVRDYPYKARYKKLGVPLADYYTTGGIHRSVWDIEAYNGKIYISSGDYDKNKGPVTVKYYDTDKKEWVNDACVPTVPKPRGRCSETALSPNRPERLLIL